MTNQIISHAPQAREMSFSTPSHIASHPPITRVVNFDGIPQYLSNLRQWILWKWEWFDGKWKKTPKQPSRYNAQSNNPGTWSTLHEVKEAYATGLFSGIGLALMQGDNLQVVDLDHCIVRNNQGAEEFSPWAKEIFEKFSSAFFELSPRDGVHIWFFAQPLTGARSVNIENSESKVEVFDHLSPRFVYFTGTSATGEICNQQESVDWLCNKFGLGSCSKSKQLAPAMPGYSNDVGAQALHHLSLEAEMERARDAAKFLKPSREKWIAYILAFKHKDHTFEFFHELCQQWPDYAGEVDCRKHWDTATPNGSVTMSTFFYDAKEIGWGMPEQWGANQLTGLLEVPAPFKVTSEGLFKQNVKEKYWEKVCDPVIVTGRTRGIEGETLGGLVLELITLQGKVMEIPISRRRLHQDGRELAQELAELNFRIEPGKEQVLLQYLGRCNPTAEIFVAERTGWCMAEDNENLVFLFPNTSTNPQYRYQPERMSGLKSVMRKSGTLEDWINNVFEPVRENAYVRYEILKSLAAPLYKFADVECGGEHIFGASTTGKTSLAQAGASVWGCGADPSGGAGKSYINNWNATANGLEGLLTQYTDVPSYFDELGTNSGDDFGRLIYAVSSGTGKASMTGKRDLRKRATWQTPITSTGEVSMLSRIEENAYGRKKTAKGGQLIRFIDREIPKNTFANRNEVEKLKRACSNFYGVLGPAFIDKIINTYSSSSLGHTVRERLEQSMQRLQSSRTNLNELQIRAMKRFAMAEVAGTLLVDFNLIPRLSFLEVRSAVDAVVTAWEPASRNLSDADRAITALREFYLANRDLKFKGYDSQTNPLLSEVSPIRAIREIAGYVDLTEKRVHMLPAAIKEATGMDPTVVAKKLAQQGWIKRERAKQDRLMSRIRIDGEQIYVYSISLDFLEELAWDDLV